MGTGPVKRRVTQDDVARAANVSRSTVSLVINGRAEGQIPEETRRRVLEAVRELGYAPNVAARMLAQGSNRLIGVFTYQQRFPFETHDFFYPFLLGIERQAAVEDYNLLLFTRAPKGGRRSVFQDGVNVLGMADGAVLMGSLTDRDELRQLVAEERPFVYVGRRDVPGCAFDWVSSDYRSGAREAASYLLAHGHRSICFTGIYFTEEPYRDRLTGCMEAVAEVPGAALHIIPDHVLDDAEAMYRFITDRDATALVCTGSRILARLIERLAPFGVAIPEDLSVVALSDEGGEFPLGLQPAHVRLNSVQVGAEAVRLLVERIEGRRKEPKSVLVPCALVPGNTVATINRSDHAWSS